MSITRRLLRRLTLAGIVAAFAALPHAAGAVTTTFVGTIGSASASRPATVDISARSNCSAVPVAMPFSGTFHYDAYSFGTLYGSQCVNVTVNSATSDGVFVTAYAVGTDYVNSPTNIIGTSGDCLPTPDAVTTFSFTSPASGFVLVVEECNSAAGSTYSVTVGAGAVAARILGMPTATRAGGATTVRWLTASEIGTVAYNVYREVNGHRVRLNARPIVAARRMYTFVDRHARRGALVRYWIQAVEVDGSRTWLGHTRVIRT